MKEVKLYRKKPVVISAYVTDEPMDIETLEGVHHASPGDYIITGVKGEQYPCKPDIFKMTYEPVEDESTADVGPCFYFQPNPPENTCTAVNDNLGACTDVRTIK